MLRVEDPFEGWVPPSGPQLRRAAQEEGEGELEAYADHLRTEAAVTPAWEDHADKLGVFADEEGPYVGLQPGDEDEEYLFGLEYGTERQPPTGLMRGVLNRYLQNRGRPSPQPGRRY